MIDFDRMRRSADWPSEVVEALMDLNERLSIVEGKEPGRPQPTPEAPA
jgi:hypothetical protein